MGFGHWFVGKKQILTNDSESKSDSVGEEGYGEVVCQLNQLLKQG